VRQDIKIKELSQMAAKATEKPAWIVEGARVTRLVGDPRKYLQDVLRSAAVQA
jgi:hypothetical protein